MTQRSPYGKAHDVYKRKLWHRIPSLDWEEVRCRIVEPYTPPTPKLRSKELEILNAPSHFHGMSIPSYTIGLTLLFKGEPFGQGTYNETNPDPTKDDYTDFLKYVAGEHKFYDERGNIFIGILTELKAERVDGGNAYKVTTTMVAIKKFAYEDRYEMPFVDVKEDHYAYDEVWEMAEAGLITVMDRAGKPVIYFRGNATITRAELVAFMNRTRKYLMRIIRQ